MDQYYDVKVSIEAWIKVKASSIEETKEKANEYVWDYDFGELNNIDWDITRIVDENGELCYAQQF